METGNKSSSEFCESNQQKRVCGWKHERGFPLCKYYGCKCKCNEHESIARTNSDKIEHLRKRAMKNVAGNKTHNMYSFGKRNHY